MARYHADTIESFQERLASNGLASPADIQPRNVLRRYRDSPPRTEPKSEVSDERALNLGRCPAPAPTMSHFLFPVRSLPHSPSLAKAVQPHPPAFLELAADLDPYWVHDAIERAGTSSRRIRRIPATLALWAVIGKALFRHISISQTTDLLALARPSNDGADPGPLDRLLQVDRPLVDLVAFLQSTYTEHLPKNYDPYFP